MTPDLPPLPEPKQPADAMFYIDGKDLFTADQLRAYAAEAVRLALSNVVPADSVACWRVNYGLDKRTPVEASQWWSSACDGMAPAGAVAALGTVLDALELKDRT